MVIHRRRAGQLLEEPVDGEGLEVAAGLDEPESDEEEDDEDDDESEEPLLAGTVDDEPERLSVR